MADSGENHHKLWIMNGDPEEGYLMSGKLMLSSIFVLFAAVVLMVGLHFLVKRYIARLRRRRYERRRDRLVSRSQILLYIDSLSVGDRGLERQVLNSLPLYFYTPRPNQVPTECAVCLSEFEFKDVVRLLPKCNHCFHLECIDTWFRSHSTCPICRSSVEQAAGTVIRPVWKFNVPEPGSSSGREQVEGNGDGGASTTTSGGRMELVEVRVEMPPWRVAVENEISQNAVANQLSLTRIPTVDRLPPPNVGQISRVGARSV